MLLRLISLLTTDDKPKDLLNLNRSDSLENLFKDSPETERSTRGTEKKPVFVLFWTIFITVDVVFRQISKASTMICRRLCR